MPNVARKWVAPNAHKLGLSRAHNTEPVGAGSMIAKWVSDRGMHVSCYDVNIASVPVDFLADPDGSWTYDALVQAAGFAAYAGVAIGTLKEPFRGHVEGAAVVTLNAESRPYVAIVECAIAYECVSEAMRAESSAA